MPVTGRTIIFRVDSSQAFGTGHIMRNIALGQACKDADMHVIFITHTESDAISESLWKNGFEIYLLDQMYPDPIDWKNTKKILSKHHDAWVVLDGYHFDIRYQELIKQAGNRLLVIDDMAKLRRYAADAILNQNLHANLVEYKCKPSTRLLLGTEYVLLRREFLKWRGYEKEIPETATKVLLLLGGIDPNNFSEKLLLLLQHMDLEIEVIMGSSNPNLKKLRQIVEEKKLRVKVFQGVTDMPSHMAWADMAITSGGTTVWELAFMGVPSLVGKTSAIEEYLTTGLRKYGLFSEIGWLDKLDEKMFMQQVRALVSDKTARQNESMKGRKMVDGYGCDRVLRVID